MTAAAQMMSANPRFGKGEGGSDSVYLRAKGKDPAHAVSAITFGSTASVAELLRMMAAVTERLTPRPDPDPAHPTLKLELWWVQNVHGSDNGLELPNPLILDQWWANDLFATAASDLAVSAGEEGKESRLWVGRVARMFEGNRGKGIDPIVARQGDMELLEVSLEGDRLTYSTQARSDLGLLTQAARIPFVADIVTHKLESDFDFAQWFGVSGGAEAEGVLNERQLSWVEPVQLDFPQGTALTEKIRLWIATCREAAANAHLAVRSVVIFDASPTHVHGALLGEKKPSSELLPYVQMEPTVDVSLFDSRDPEEGLTLRMYVRIQRTQQEAGQVTPPSP